jgi:hypothetical protein
MRAIVLIGINFVRTQWLTIAVMAVYLLGIALVFAHNPDIHEAGFFLKMHTFYLIFLAMTVATPAVQMERRTRRILAVLSKGIHRWQYLGGILCGAAMISGIFCLLVGGISLVLCWRGGYPTAGLAGLTVALFACCLMASAAGLFFAAFLNPFLATGATTLTLALPLITERSGWQPLAALFPAAWLARNVMGYQFGKATDAHMISASALAFAILFWMAAAAVFARRDVTISPE